MSTGLIKIVIGSVVALFVLGFISIFMYLITDSFFQEFNNTGLNDTNTAIIEDSSLSALSYMDWIIVLFMVIVIISSMVIGYRLSTPPIFFIITFVASMFLGLISWILNYVFKEIVIQSQFASVINYFPYTIIICTNLHWIALTCILAGSIASYTNRGQSQSEF